MRRPKRPQLSSELEARLALLREASYNAIATSLTLQLDAAMLIVSLVQSQVMSEDERIKFLDYAKRVLSATESRFWKSSLNPTEVFGISTRIERLWFAVDALQ